MSTEKINDTVKLADKNSITVRYKDRPYMLEYDRKTVKAVEAQTGMSAQDLISNMSITTRDTLFRYAFFKHHRSLVVGNAQVIDDIYDNIANRNKLLSKLTEMFAKTVIALLDPDIQNEQENVESLATWE